MTDHSSPWAVEYFTLLPGHLDLQHIIYGVAGFWGFLPKTTGVHSMFQTFANDADGGDRPSIPASLRRFSDDSESLKVMLIGSTEGITETIHNLHQRGFAEVGAWSPLVP